MKKKNLMVPATLLVGSLFAGTSTAVPLCDGDYDLRTFIDNSYTIAVAPPRGDKCEFSVNPLSPLSAPSYSAYLVPGIGSETSILTFAASVALGGFPLEEVNVHLVLAELTFVRDATSIRPDALSISLVRVDGGPPLLRVDMPGAAEPHFAPVPQPLDFRIDWTRGEGLWSSHLAVTVGDSIGREAWPAGQPLELKLGIVRTDADLYAHPRSLIFSRPDLTDDLAAE